MIEFAYIATKSPAVPHVTRAIRGDQVGTDSSHRMLCYLDGSSRGGCKTGNLVYPYGILGEPDGPLWCNRDAIRIAIWCMDRIVYHLMSTEVEETDFIRTKLGEPEVALCIEDQVIW